MIPKLAVTDLLILGYFQFPESADRQITDSVFLCPRTNCRCVGLLIVCPQFPNIISVLLQLSVRRGFIGKNRVNQIHILNVAGESTWNFVPGLRAVDDRPICWSVDRCCRLSICRCVDRFIGGSAIDSSTVDRSTDRPLRGHPITRGTLLSDTWWQIFFLAGDRCDDSTAHPSTSRRCGGRSKTRLLPQDILREKYHRSEPIPK
jgi:hypothetical protein